MASRGRVHDIHLTVSQQQRRERVEALSNRCRWVSAASLSVNVRCRLLIRHLSALRSFVKFQQRFSPAMSKADVVAGTWTFSRGAVCVASQALERYSVMDALEMGINSVEDDRQTGCYFVGRGSYRNAVGRHQFDAALMIGANSSFGSVAALSGFGRPFSVARSVLERSNHSMLVGEGASRFAETHGFLRVTEEELDDDNSLQAWQKFQECGDRSIAPQSSPPDTLGVIIRTAEGRVTVGISTSGPAFKADGRVGDSPLPGSGLYADDAAGGCVASGDGDIAMCYCPSHDVVRRMRHGCSAGRACDEVIQEMVNRAGQRFEMALLAVHATSGEIGAATTVDHFHDLKTDELLPGFPYVMWRTGEDVRVVVQPPIPKLT